MPEEPPKRPTETVGRAVTGTTSGIAHSNTPVGHLPSRTQQAPRAQIPQRGLTDLTMESFGEGRAR